MFFKKKPKIFCDTEFDFSKINIFCIERDFHYIGVTTIGIIDKNDEIIEWQVEISEEKHNELVKRFRSQIGIKTV